MIMIKSFSSSWILCRLVLAQNAPKLSLLKFLPLTYHHSLDFTSFFTIAFLGAALFFLQLGCFGLDINKTQDSYI